MSLAEKVVTLIVLAVLCEDYQGDAGDQAFQENQETHWSGTRKRTSSLC